MVYHMQVRLNHTSDHTPFFINFFPHQVQTNDVDQLALEKIPPTSSFNKHFLEFDFSPRVITPVDVTPMVKFICLVTVM